MRPPRLTVHFPETEEGTYELVCSVAQMHADGVFKIIQSFQVPAGQKDCH